MLSLQRLLPWRALLPPAFLLPRPLPRSSFLPARALFELSPIRFDVGLLLRIVADGGFRLLAPHEGLFESHRIAELLLRRAILRFKLFQQVLETCQHIFICRLLPCKAILVLDAGLREDAHLFLEILFILRHDAARALFELLLDARILLRMKQHAHEVAALFRVRHQECAEFALRKQHDLAEFFAVKARQHLDALRDIAEAADNQRFTAIRLHIIELCTRGRRALAVFALVFRPPQHMICARAERERQFDFGLRLGPGISRTQHRARAQRAARAAIECE